MKTIFLQVNEDDYATLVDGLCLAINLTNKLAYDEIDMNNKSLLEKEAYELDTLLKNLGDQAYGQRQ